MFVHCRDSAAPPGKGQPRRTPQQRPQARVATADDHHFRLVRCGVLMCGDQWNAERDGKGVDGASGKHE